MGRTVRSLFESARSKLSQRPNADRTSICRGSLEAAVLAQAAVARAGGTGACNTRAREAFESAREATRPGLIPTSGNESSQDWVWRHNDAEVGKEVARKVEEVRQLLLPTFARVSLT